MIEELGKRLGECAEKGEWKKFDKVAGEITYDDIESICRYCLFEAPDSLDYYNSLVHKMEALTSDYNGDYAVKLLMGFYANINDCHSMANRMIHRLLNSNGGVDGVVRAMWIIPPHMRKSLFERKYECFTKFDIESKVYGDFDASNLQDQKNVVIPEGVFMIKQGAFENNETIESVTMPSTLKCIDGDAFKKCKNLKTLNLNDGLLSICWYAFSDCGFDSVQVPDSVVSMGKEAFTNFSSPVTKINMPKFVQYSFGGLFRNTMLESYGIPSTLRSLGGSTFASCTTLEEMTIPNLITQIDSVGTFWGCTNIKKAELPISIKTYGHSMFLDCVNLEEVISHDNVTEIGTKAFMNCGKLSKIEFPQECVQVGQNAFTNCASIKALSLPACTKVIMKNAFEGCSSLESINLENVRTIEEASFKNCLSLSEIKVGNMFTLSNSSFEGCKSLKKVEGAIAYIKERAFADCENLDFASVVASATAIEKEAFANCKGSKELTIPNIKTLKDKAFAGCSTLKSVVIADGVTKLPAGLFAKCTALESVTIPSSVVEIGRSAFGGCKNLALCNVNSNVKIGKDAFKDTKINL